MNKDRATTTTRPAAHWTMEFPAAITVCDAEGRVLELNDLAAANYAQEGGRELIGHSIFDCHPAPAREKLRQLMAERRSNAYTIEKGDLHKFIYQAPWFSGGDYRGFVEISIEIPGTLPHFVRAGPAS